jgi:hypothetical protein
MERKRFCEYVYVTGKRKGEKCGKFCRKGRGLCYVHYAQLQKGEKKKPEVVEQIEDKPEEEPKAKQQMKSKVLEIEQSSEEEQQPEENEVQEEQQPEEYEIDIQEEQQEEEIPTSRRYDYDPQRIINEIYSKYH